MPCPWFSDSLDWRSRLKQGGWFLDILVIPTLLFAFLYNPNYCHGIMLPWDEGQHLACISGLFQGKVIYRDIYDISAPLQEFIPYWMMKLSSADIVVLRSFYYFGTLLSLITIYFAATRLMKSRTAVVLAILLCVKFSIFNFWASRWGGFRIGSAYVAIMLLWSYLDSGKRFWLFACGAASAFSFLFSQEMGLICLTIVFLAIVLKPRRHAADTDPIDQTRSSKVLRFALGFAVGFGPWLIYCLATGALWSYVRISFIDIPFRLTRALPYGYDLLPLPRGWWSLTSWLGFFTTKTGWFYLAWLILGVEVLYLATVGMRGRWNKDCTRRLTIFVLGVYLIALAKRCIHEGAPQLNYSLSPTLLILVCQLQSGLYWIWEKMTAPHMDDRSGKRLLVGRAMIGIVMLLPAGVLLSHLAHRNQGRPYQLINTRLPRAENGKLNLDGARGIRMPIQEARMLEKISRFIIEKTLPSDPLFTFPFEGRFYFLTGRRNSTRFDIALNTAIDDKYQKEAIRDLELSPPPYIIHDRKVWKLGGRNAIPNEERTPLLIEYISSHYEQAFEVEGIAVMRRIGLDINSGNEADRNGGDS